MKKKRTYNTRLIKDDYSYSIEQVADLFHVDIATVRRWVRKEGLKRLPYYNPHSFRKMLTTWAMEHCSQIEFKAISQNIGHEHAITTYNSYGMLNDYKRQNVIKSIGEGKTDISHVPVDVLMREMQRRMQG